MTEDVPLPNMPDSKRDWVRVPRDVDWDRWVSVLKDAGVARPYECLAAFIGCSESAIQEVVLEMRRNG